jgi:hypothetical protein
MTAFSNANTARRDNPRCRIETEGPRHIISENDPLIRASISLIHVSLHFLQTTLAVRSNAHGAPLFEFPLKTMLLSETPSKAKQISHPVAPDVFRRELYGLRRAKCTPPHSYRLTADSSTHRTGAQTVEALWPPVGEYKGRMVARTPGRSSRASLFPPPPF